MLDAKFNVQLSAAASIPNSEGRAANTICEKLARGCHNEAQAMRPPDTRHVKASDAFTGC